MYAPLRRARPIVLALALGSAGASIAAAQQSPCRRGAPAARGQHL